MSLSPVTTRVEVAPLPSTSPLMGSPRREGMAATASSLSSMAASAVENISSDVAQQKLIDNACKAVKHVMYVHPCGGFDRAIGGHPVVSVKALLVFKLDGKVVATFPGSLETLKGEEVYSQKVLDAHNWDRQQWSILKGNPERILTITPR